MPESNIPGWADIVANARAEAERNPQAFINGTYAGETYATCALNNAACEGHADEEYGSNYRNGYEVAAFRLTAEDAQTLDYRNNDGTLLCCFAVIRDDQGFVQTYAYETEQGLSAFISELEHDLAAGDDEYDWLVDDQNRAQNAKPQPAPEPHEQPPLL